jgi:hypothetical protein
MPELKTHQKSFTCRHCVSFQSRFACAGKSKLMRKA